MKVFTLPKFDPYHLNQDYTYYFVPAPWLSVKLLRLLQNYQPPEDPGVQMQPQIVLLFS